MNNINKTSQGPSTSQNNTSKYFYNNNTHQLEKFFNNPSNIYDWIEKAAAKNSSNSSSSEEISCFTSESSSRVESDETNVTNLSQKKRNRRRKSKQNKIQQSSQSDEEQKSNFSWAQIVAERPKSGVKEKNFTVEFIKKIIEESQTNSISITASLKENFKNFNFLKIFTEICKENLLNLVGIEENFKIVNFVKFIAELYEENLLTCTDMTSMISSLLHLPTETSCLALYTFLTCSGQKLDKNQSEEFQVILAFLSFVAESEKNQRSRTFKFILNIRENNWKIDYLKVFNNLNFENLEELLQNFQFNENSVEEFLSFLWENLNSFELISKAASVTLMISKFHHGFLKKLKQNLENIFKNFKALPQSEVGKFSLFTVELFKLKIIDVDYFSDLVSFKIFEKIPKMFAMKMIEEISTVKCNDDGYKMKIWTSHLFYMLDKNIL